MFRPSRTKQLRHAFTLVEILIVVIVIGILAAIAVPNFSQGTSDARYEVARSFGQSLTKAASMYTTQTGRIPSSFYSWVALTETGSQQNLIRVDSNLRGALKERNQDVMTNNAQTIELRFPGDMIARYTIDSNGVITTTVTP